MLRVLLPIGLVGMFSVAAACKKQQDQPPQPQQPPQPGVVDPKATPPAADAAPKAEEPAANTTDSELAGVMLGLDQHAWKPVPSLPPGAQISVVEGTPPFAEPKSFTFVLKLPKDYKIPPHTHLVTERVTVLSGTFNIGHGDTFDKTKTKAVTAGGVVLVPVGHTHFVWTKGETILQLQGVGPWGIFYVDPKDDPRKPAPVKPALPATSTDSAIEMTLLNPADIKWAAAPPSLPPGAEIAVLEGAPPFATGSFVFRLKLPDGFKIPVHHHLVTERVTVVAGTLKFGMGETWDDAALKPMAMGGVIVMPRGHKHFVQAVGETIVQLQGVGPWGIIYANPDEDPRTKKK